MLQQITSFILGNKKKTFFFVFFACFLVFVNPSFAQDTLPSVASNIQEGWENIKVLSEVIDGLSWLISLIGLFVSWFLSGEWSTGSFLGLDSAFSELWQLVANVVYMIFAGIFVWIAFASIVGLEGSNYELKSSLPKLIIGILIVPFTQLIISFLISISILLTHSVMQFGLEGYTPKCSLYLDSKTGAKYNENQELEKAYDRCIKDTEGQANVTTGGAYSLVSYYIYDVVDFEGIKGVSTNISNTTQEDVDELEGDNFIATVAFFFGNLIGDLIVFGILLLIFMALFIALVIRVIRIWIYTIFSPVLALAYYFGKDSSELFKKINFTDLISLMLVPVYVAFALSIGVIILDKMKEGVGKSNLVDGGFDTFDSDLSIRYGDFSGSALNSDGEEVNISKTGVIMESGDLSVVFHYDWLISAFTTTSNFASNASEQYNNSGASGVVDSATSGWGSSFIGKIIAYIFGISFLWIGVMAAIKSNDITSSAATEFDKMGKGIGSFAMSAPKYMPIMPGMSLDGLATGSGQLEASLVSASTKRMEPHERKIKKMFGVYSISNNDLHTFKAELNEKGTKNLEGLQEVVSRYRSWHKKYGKNDVMVKKAGDSIMDIIKSDNIPTSFTRAAAQAGVSLDKIKKDPRGLRGDDFLKFVHTAANEGDIISSGPNAWYEMKHEYGSSSKSEDSRNITPEDRFNSSLKSLNSDMRYYSIGDERLGDDKRLQKLEEGGQDDVYFGYTTTSSGGYKVRVINDGNPSEVTLSSKNIESLSKEEKTMLAQKVISKLGDNQGLRKQAIKKLFGSSISEQQVESILEDALSSGE